MSAIFNPYLDREFNDLTQEAEDLTKSVLDDIKRDPDYYAELVADFYLHWAKGTFETGMMHKFHKSIISKK